MKNSENINEKGDIFRKALKNFMFDVASGGAIKHLTDKGFTTKEIKEKLDFPTPENVIMEASWNRLVSKRIILLEDPNEKLPEQNYKYVKVYGKYGKTSLKRVLIDENENGINDIKKEDYAPINFGVLIYKDQKAFEKSLNVLEERDKDYILGLPWPKKIVYHKMDNRMKRILRKLRKQNGK